MNYAKKIDGMLFERTAISGKPEEFIRKELAAIRERGPVNPERFIALTLREPFDYTEWRRTHLYLDNDLHSLAERAREAGRRIREKDALNAPV